MTVSRLNTLPFSVGAGFKPQHFDDIQQKADRKMWFEIHAENYMSRGGPTLQMLERLRSDFDISVHGVGLSIGSARGLDREHLARLRTLCDQIEPASFSEHLAWSSHSVGFLNDLLPVPYNSETLTQICEHVDQVQTALGRPMLLENPSSYLEFKDSSYEETAFLKEISDRTGCGLLLDINNVYVSAVNLGFDASRYLDNFPKQKIGEIHLAGHSSEQSDSTETLLVDAHDRPVADPVWSLYRSFISENGAIPTLIEWDNDIPDWDTLSAEVSKAQTILNGLARVEEGASHVA
ncbi:DUF692 domain-containing protein [Sneathiella sp.]|uniref:MNIO family bufferin maturase n=1 Tax=Sneathiella sp. TaxID=1964365 RepID=UPI0039E40B78